MAIEWRCQCGRGLKAADTAVGRYVRCPDCRRVAQVPEPPPADIRTAATIDLSTSSPAAAAAPASAMLGPRPGSHPAVTSSTMPPVSAAALAYANSHRQSHRGYLIAAILVALALLVMVLAVRWSRNRHAPSSVPVAPPEAVVGAGSAAG